MADTEHAAILSGDAHEPKHITSTTTGDAGKVLTPSSSTNGISTLRQLTESEVLSVVDYYTHKVIDISTAHSEWLPIPKAGTVTSIVSCLSGVIATADCAITFEIGGVAIGASALTIAFTGSAAGDLDTATPTTNNGVAANQPIEIITDGASTNAEDLTITIGVTRS